MQATWNCGLLLIGKVKGPPRKVDTQFFAATQQTGSRPHLLPFPCIFSYGCGFSTSQLHPGRLTDVHQQAESKART